ncbi:MAG TPA: DUF190 domain-containing protein, partial [bacterium]|nr:DUF190 domain-containing protein [bacterium]
SAGREGTAIQMGGSIASAFQRFLPLSPQDRGTLLMAGMAAGFGGIFGTPLAGAIFALEVLAIGRLSYEALIPCLIAAVMSDWTCAAWGIRHTDYHLAALVSGSSGTDIAGLDGILMAKVIAASAAFGLASVLFAELAHGLHAVFRKIVPWPYLRPALGGAAVIAMTYALGTRDYLGLGVGSPDSSAVTILSSFHAGGAGDLSWLWKILFTVVTLSSGFKGGEVTPLFFIGAALGNALSRWMGAPPELFAALGFVAIFAGATNTPLACTIMAIELFGPAYVVYFAVACYLAYFLSGHSGIYLSQRIAAPKLRSPALPPHASLRAARELKPSLIPSRFARSVQPRSGSAAKGETIMTHRHKVVPREIGQVRIYLTPKDRRNVKGLKRFTTKPLYREIIAAAKKDGIPHAVAHRTHHGYSGRGDVQSEHPEYANPSLNLCVEMIGERDQLEKFCRKHGELLQGKVIVYKHVEHWDIHAHDLVETDVQPDELKGGN